MRVLYCVQMATVFVIAGDWTLRTAVRAELREMGVEALGFETLADAGRARVEGTAADVMVVDATSIEMRGVELEALARGAELVVIASGIERAALPVKAAAVLRKPVSVGEIVAAVRHIMEGRPA